jgi:hypothetical protein
VSGMVGPRLPNTAYVPRQLESRSYPGSGTESRPLHGPRRGHRRVLSGSGLLRPRGPDTCTARRSRVGPSSDGRNAGGEGAPARPTAQGTPGHRHTGPVQRGLGRRAIRVRAGAEPARAAQHDPGPRPKGAQNLSRKYATKLTGAGETARSQSAAAASHRAARFAKPGGAACKEVHCQI